MYGVNLIVLTFHVSSVAYANSDLVPNVIEEKESLTSGNKALCPGVELTTEDPWPVTESGSLGNTEIICLWLEVEGHLLDWRMWGYFLVVVMS